MSTEETKLLYRVQLIAIGENQRARFVVHATTPEDAIKRANRYLAETGRAYLAVNAQLEERWQLSAKNCARRAMYCGKCKDTCLR